MGSCPVALAEAPAAIFEDRRVDKLAYLFAGLREGTCLQAARIPFRAFRGTTSRTGLFCGTSGRSRRRGCGGVERRWPAVTIRLRYGEGQGWRWGLIRAKKDRIIGQGERNAHNIAQRMFDSIWLLLRRVCKATGLINHNRTPVGMERRTSMIHTVEKDSPKTSKSSKQVYNGRGLR